MAHDIACIILEKAKEIDKKEHIQKKELFMENALDNHYNICIELIAKGTQADIEKRYHFGCRSFYRVDNELYIGCNDMFKPTWFVNLTKHYDDVFRVLLRCYYHYKCNMNDENNLCIRLSIACPVYTKKNNKKWYFRRWNNIETFDYDPKTPIETVLEEALRFIMLIQIV
jgi:hypothetical protein